MPFKSKEESNAAQRRRYATNPEVRRKSKIAVALWMAKNKEKFRKYANEWRRTRRKENPEQFRKSEFAWAIFRRRGITVQQYQDMVDKQGGVCAICKKPETKIAPNGFVRRLSIDHDHKCCPDINKSCSKCIRGLLCWSCNTTLHVLERKDWISKAENYLRDFQRRF